MASKKSGKKSGKKRVKSEPPKAADENVEPAAEVEAQPEESEPSPEPEPEESSEEPRPEPEPDVEREPLMLVTESKIEEVMAVAGEAGLDRFEKRDLREEIMKGITESGMKSLLRSLNTRAVKIKAQKQEIAEKGRAGTYKLVSNILGRGEKPGDKVELTAEESVHFLKIGAVEIID